MYNSIYPNINYHKYNLQQNARLPYPAKQNQQVTNYQQPQSRPQQSATEKDGKQTFPNGTKTSIDYTKGQINISQVITDFKNTIIAISAPNEVKDEVYLYLNLVDRESKKENPSRDIILANLKNASRISDNYIAASLNKPSNVVEGWIDALFLQKINLKSNPDEINPEFLLEFPKHAQDRIDEQNQSEQIQNAQQQNTEAVVEEAPLDLEKIAQESQQDQLIVEGPESLENGNPQIKYEDIEVESSLELSDIQTSDTSTPDSVSDFNPVSVADAKAKEIFTRAKQLPHTENGYTDAINMFNEALGLMENSDEVNGNIKAAIHLERGKIFDRYDYVDYALRDFHEATKADDLNLKANAFFKSGKIYDEFREYSPALDNYFSSVAYSGEAENYQGQTTVLSKIADLYAKQYDLEKCDDYSSLALDTAQQTDNEILLANTYSNNAQNYQYLGENDKALDGYKNALAIFSRTDESYEQMAHNYEQASVVMSKLGNQLKAAKLQEKALLYFQLAQQSDEQKVLAS